MIRFFTAHPTVANLLMGIIIILGLMSLPALQREKFPSFSTDMVRISVAYPGASAEDVEEAICQKIEDAIDGVSFIEEVTSSAKEGFGSVTVEMSEAGDIRIFLDDIKAEVDAITDFPDLVEDVTVSELNRIDFVASIAVTGPMDNTTLKSYCREIKDDLRALPQVTNVSIGGFSDRQIRIKLDKSTLLSYGLSVKSLSQTISRQNINMPAGMIEGDRKTYLIRFLDERKTVEEYKDIVVHHGVNGAEIKLGDIAKIEEQFQSDDIRTELNGKKAGTLLISKTRNQDALRVFSAVEEFFKKKRKTSPPGVEFTITREMASPIKDRLAMIAKNGLQGLILVFLTMWFFFSFRLSIWVTIGLPISFLGTFFLMPLFGLTINMITLVALLISIGILMDDAIVLSENIATFLRKGYNSFDATVKGINQVKMGVIYSFLTTVAVFLPLSFLAGNMGKVLYVIPIVLIIVLSVSLIEAFLILPNHLFHTMKNYDPNKTNRVRKLIQRIVDWTREKLVGSIVDVAVRFRYLVLGLIIMILLISVSMVAGGKLKYRPFPPVVKDTIECKILLPQGTAGSRTNQVVARIVKALDVVREKYDNKQPDGKKLIEDVLVNFGVNTDAGESGSHVASIFVDLLSAEYRVTLLDDVVDLWKKSAGKITDAISITYGAGAAGPSGKAFEVDLVGTNLNELKAASVELQIWLNQFKGVRNIVDNMRVGKPEIRMSLKPGASALGLTGADIAAQLRGSFFGSKADEIQKGKETYEIEVWLSEEDRNTIYDLENTMIVAPNKSLIPLGTLVTFKEDYGWSRISHVDGLRTVTIRGDVNPRLANATEINNKMMAEFTPILKKKYPNIKLQQGGESEQNRKTMLSMIRAFTIGILTIFVLLSFQFRSYLEPLVVMFVIPFTIIGVIWGHYLLGLTLCMPSVMGFISLCGIVVNDSLLLVEFVKIRGKGMQVIDAAKAASRDRFRAVMITSATTVVGIMPMLFEKSVQAQILRPLVASIGFGLMTSTILVLFVVPCLYVILDDFGISTFGKKGEHDKKLAMATAE